MNTWTSPTGPLTSDELRALADAPYGVAVKAIRKHDPLYGRSTGKGEPRSWKVKVTQQVYMVGYVTIEAVSAEDAELLVEAMPDSKIDWKFDDCETSEIEEVTPA